MSSTIVASRINLIRFFANFWETLLRYFDFVLSVLVTVCMADCVHVLYVHIYRYTAKRAVPRLDPAAVALCSAG